MSAAQREVRDRLVLPLAIPLGAMGLIAILVFSFSRVLLAAPKEVAVAVALMVAVNVLAMCAVLAARPRGTGSNPLLLAAVAFVPIVLGLVAMGVVAEPKGEEAATSTKVHTEAKTGPAKASISANRLAFSAPELSLPADRPVTLEFDNREPVPHNLGIFRGADDTGEKVFTGEVFSGPKKTSYRLSPLAPGAYYFRCDVHPTIMKGSIKVA